MISRSIDDAGRVFTLSYSSHVTPSEVNDFRDAVRHHMDRLRPGFVLLSDLSNLKSMDPACAEGLGVLMEAISERGPSLVLRVIPDPSKDIGLNLISLFHCWRPVRTHTRTNLAEAVKCLLIELPGVAGKA